MGRIVHFEIPATDPEKSMSFYTNVFGWEFKKFGNEQYWFANTGDEKAPGINGAIMKRKDPLQPVTNNIGVENIDEAIKKVTTAGGKIVVPKTEIPGAGWFCYFTDPDNNIFGIWQPTKK